MFLELLNVMNFTVVYAQRVCDVLFLPAIILFSAVKDEFVVVDGKAKTKGKERRVFLFEKIIIFSEPMTREGGLPEFRYVHNMKVNITLIHL